MNELLTTNPIDLIENACKAEQLRVILDSETTLDKYGCFTMFQEEACKMAVAYGMQASIALDYPYILVQFVKV